MENNEFEKSNLMGSEEINKTSVSPQQSFENGSPSSSLGGGKIDSLEKKSIGAIVGSIIIIVIIIIGGLYFWGKQISKEDALLNTTAEDIQKQPDEVLNSLETQKTSDEITDIEADLGTTDLNNLEGDLDNIDLELSF